MCWWIEIRDLKLFNLAILAKSNLVLASQPTFLVLSKLLSVFFFPSHSWKLCASSSPFTLGNWRSTAQARMVKEIWRGTSYPSKPLIFNSQKLRKIGVERDGRCFTYVKIFKIFPYDVNLYLFLKKN